MDFEGLSKLMWQKLEMGFAPDLSYHNYKHVKDVYQSAQWLAEQEQVNPADLKILLTAVLFHDAGFMKSRENHEVFSCNMASEMLPDFGYEKEEIQHVCQLIMATRIPHEPKNQLEEIICDADLDYLGRPDFWETGNLLLMELNGQGANLNLKQWNQLQIRFLESHKYFTRTSRQHRQSQKEKYLQELKTKAINLE
jgi:exopolyphosphatase/pppGpp-phosphohydrolase